MIPVTGVEAAVQIAFLVGALLTIGGIILIRVKSQDGDGVGCIEIILAIFALAMLFGAAGGPQAFINFWPGSMRR